MKKIKTKHIIITLTLLAITLIVLMKTGVLGGEKEIFVETAKVEVRDISESISASGKIQPVTDVKISSDVSGEIIDLPVKEGDKVKKGQLLVRIKPDEYQRQTERAQAIVNNSKASVSSAKAQVAQAKATLQKSKLNYDRSKKLLEQNLIPLAEFETVEAEYQINQSQLESAFETVKGAEYSLQSAIASLKEAQYALSKTSIFAPMDGTISVLNVELGERVVGTMQMAGTEMMRVSNLSVMEAKVEVNENDITRLNVNDSAEIEIDAFRGVVFKGVVTSIANSSGTLSDQISSEKVTNFQVKIRVVKAVTKKGEEKEYVLKPGMNCSVLIFTKNAKGVLTVPILAVTIRDKKEDKDKKAQTSSDKDQNQEFVFVLESDKAVLKSVETGLQDDNFIEIKKGITAKDLIISGPYNLVSKDLIDGQKVRSNKLKDEK